MATKSTATAAPKAETPVFPAVDPQKLADFNLASSQAARYLRGAADLVDQVVLARITADQFNTDIGAAMGMAQSNIDTMANLLSELENPNPTPPELDTYARLGRDPNKPWPPEAASA